jgi:hypothetical protein
MVRVTTFSRIKWNHQRKPTIAAELRLMPARIETVNGSLVLKRRTE